MPQLRNPCPRYSGGASKAAKGVICGFGPLGYELAIEALAASLEPKKAR